MALLKFVNQKSLGGNFLSTLLLHKIVPSSAIAKANKSVAPILLSILQVMHLPSQMKIEQRGNIFCGT